LLQAITVDDDDDDDGIYEDVGDDEREIIADCGVDDNGARTARLFAVSDALGQPSRPAASAPASGEMSFSLGSRSLGTSGITAIPSKGDACKRKNN
jgi:hypothetical protein